VPPLSAGANQFLEDFLSNFSPADAAEVKAVERTTNHDVKAVEYVIKDRLAAHPELAGAYPVSLCTLHPAPCTVNPELCTLHRKP
jgi:hypothetical protein